MTSTTLVATIIAAAIAFMVLMKAFYHRGSSRTDSVSNNLMQLRIFIQVIVLGLILLALWLSGGGRPD
ncbi:Trk-type K+ transport system membrane component [Neorhizobium sp. 2083]|uniref:HIG1 domain-containing protein n=1 Tax=Neorhizobium sp. 2083 TaxID=2817762 RepID=UPI002867728B|nr:HIG1 domain-containing protein [Neorhizobium sp. 2083]MDR6820107.1 Trk-type K+ transport system membrane component [Neorhizobium sp. 2083]